MTTEGPGTAIAPRTRVCHILDHFFIGLACEPTVPESWG
jgi:hypothetical protein